MEFNEQNNNEVAVAEDETRSKLTFDEHVIQKIVSMVIKDMDGITTVKSGGTFSGIVGRGSSEAINVEVGQSEVAVDLRLLLRYGKNAKEIYNELKEKIENQVFEMTGLKVVEVNAKIEDVLTEDEYKTKQEN